MLITWITPITIWRETLVPLKFGEIDEQPKSRQVFTIQMFTHLWLKPHINNEYRTNSLEDISYARTQQFAARIPSITFLRSMACGLCEFPTFHSQGKSPSAKGISHIRILVLTVASNHWTYNKMCKLSFHTHKLPDIIAIYCMKNYTGHMHTTPKLSCKGHAQYSNSPNLFCQR